ncbi:MAG: hypothetical protein GY854_32520 [Deltaproteobacteria bacterium]|nr:hypothetical protein [Deltaproteobacteria bacterium]
MLKKGIVLLIILLATVVLFVPISCEEEEGEKCCKCNCFDVDLCNPIRNYTIRGEDMDCVEACKDKCDMYHCSSKDPEACDPETSE